MSGQGDTVTGLVETLLDAARRSGLLGALGVMPLRPQDLARELGLRERPVRALCQVLADFGYLSGDPEYGFSVDPMGAFSASSQPFTLQDTRLIGLLTAERIVEGLRRPLGVGADWIPNGDAVARAAGLALSRFPKARAVLVVGHHQDRLARFLLNSGIRVTAVVDIRELGTDAPGGTRGETSMTGGTTVPQKFDLIVLVGVTHKYGWQESSILFYNMSRCLMRHGGLAVVDWVRGCGLDAALLGLDISLRGEIGDCYGEADYRMWLKSAGFVGIVFHELGAGALKLVLAQKGGRG